MFGNLTYLVFELLWAAPVLLLQWLFGWRTLWRNRRVLATATGLATAYLSLSDGVAIAAGIWRLHHDRIIGLYAGNVPVEEVAFFLFTNALVIQAVVLLLDEETQTRARAVVTSFSGRLKRLPSRP